MSLNSIKINTNQVVKVDEQPTAGSDNLVKSGNVNGFMYVNMQPYIKELYINEAGKQADLATLHIVKASNNNFSLNFSNTAMTAFVATTGQYDSKDAASGVLPIVDFNNVSILYGYIIIDWNLLSSDIDPLTPLNSICFDINYSPSIKNKYLEEDVFDISTIKSDVDMLSEVVIGKDTAIKNFSLLELVYSDLNTYIYFQYPKNNKVNKVNQIRYKSLSGTTNFYKVTVTGATATYHLIATVTNPVSDNGIIKVLPINTQTLADNEYIGLAGSFYFGVDDNAQGFTGNHVNMSNGEISSEGEIAMGYSIEYSEALDVKIENLQLESEEVDISSYGPAEGNVISNYENVIVLASDGTGDYTTFIDAHTFCSNATNKYKTTLVIMPGIYDIPVRNDSGYVICYNIKGVGNPILKSYNETGNVDIKTTFSPFMMDTNTPSFHHSVSIEGITLIGKNVRYCVHDELGGLQQPSYTHVFKDCKFVHLTAPDSDWTMPRCIGGGLGNNGLVIIDNCEFQSEIDTSVDYHTGFDGGAESSKVIVKDCIFANNTVSCSSTTYSSNESVMVVESCILHSEPIYTDEYNNQDFELISKNNIIV